MELASTVINAAVVAAVGLILAWVGKGQFQAVHRRIDKLEDRMDRFQASLDSLRSDLTQVALAVGARPRAENV
jgi:type II secretory pathway component PulJ